MKNPKKGPFDLSVDLDMIPGYRSRFLSMDVASGPQIKMSDSGPSTEQIREKDSELKSRLGSGTDTRSLPSVILRRKGVRV